MQEGNVTPEHSVSPRSHRRNFFNLGLALLLAVTMFFSGLHIGSFSSASNTSQTAGLFSIFSTSATDSVSGNAQSSVNDTDLSEFWAVWELMEQKYAAATDTDQTTDDRVRGAIQGLVRSYDDPYSVYLPPKDADYFEQDISGNFGGVGMEVGMRDGVITVIAPLPNTPAEEAGVMAGDVIISVDGESTEDMGIDDAVRLIRGEEGTDVVLTIYREGETEFIDITVTRAQIDIPTIETELRDDVFIISLYSFNALAERKVQEALREYVRSDASKLVLDLRGNPGGFLQGAIGIASFFLPTGKVVVRESFGAEEEDRVYRSSGEVAFDFTPETMVVLVDRGSASASEIVAGALGGHDTATIMGQTTFGKGSVQELVDLPTGASLKVTVARWMTPDGTSISNGGLEPDIAVEYTAEDRENDIDPQLEAAVSFLNGTYEPDEEDVASLFE